jgi:pimeloyl-[acyl-carrier protein] methyl ester esterase
MIDNGADRQALILPGWATDWRVFRGLSPSLNLVSPCTFLPETYLPAVRDFLQQTSDRHLIVAGWSLGSFAALQLARELPDAVGGLILIGARRSYPAEDIQTVRGRLERNKAGCLRRFYRECFLPSQKEDFKRFRSGLMETYLEQMLPEDLEAGLDYLADREITVADAPPCKTLFVHGGNDAVAPLSEARWLVDRMERAQMLVVGTGHAAFLSPEFEAVLNDV